MKALFALAAAASGAGDEDEDGGFRSEIHPRYLREGSEVEVRSHDNRCWYRGVIFELSNANVKARVYYRDLPHPANDPEKLEMWVPTQSCIRPAQLFQRLIAKVEIGTWVEAWWRCGWYKGVVVSSEFPVGRFRVRVDLAGEKREQTFPLADLRISQEWSETEGRWIPRPSNEAAGESSSQVYFDDDDGSRFEKESSTKMMAISNHRAKKLILIDAIPNDAFPNSCKFSPFVFSFVQTLTGLVKSS